MQPTRDATDAPREPQFSPGQTVRARFGSGVVAGEVREVREEPTGDRRIVIDPFDEDVEVDTDADRVEHARACPSCGAVVDRGQSYRCPSCGADLVGE